MDSPVSDELFCPWCGKLAAARSIRLGELMSVARVVSAQHSRPFDSDLLSLAAAIQKQYPEMDERPSGIFVIACDPSPKGCGAVTEAKSSRHPSALGGMAKRGSD